MRYGTCAEPSQLPFLEDTGQQKGTLLVETFSEHLQSFLLPNLE